MMACLERRSAHAFERELEKSPYMRRTSASPIFAISSNRPSAIFTDALSASIRTASLGERVYEGIAFANQRQHPDDRAMCQRRITSLESWTRTRPSPAA